MLYQLDHMVTGKIFLGEETSILCPLSSVLYGMEYPDLAVMEDPVGSDLDTIDQGGHKF